MSERRAIAEWIRNRARALGSDLPTLPMEQYRITRARMGELFHVADLIEHDQMNEKTESN